MLMLTGSVDSSNCVWPVSSPWSWASLTDLSCSPHCPHTRDSAAILSRPYATQRAVFIQCVPMVAKGRDAEDKILIAIQRENNKLRCTASTRHTVRLGAPL